MKVLIGNEEVVCSNNFTIEQEMLSTPSVILNNVYPKSWEDTKDYVSNFYYPEDYSKCLIYDGEQIDNFEILGETSQQTYTGKNLIPFTNQDFTLKGIHYYVVDGNLYLDGTSTGETYSTNASFKTNFSFTLSAGTYTFSRNTYIYPAYIDNKSTGTHLVTNSGTFTLSEETEVNFGFYIYNKTFNNQLIPVQLEKGSSATEYEPYVGGEPIPNPDNPEPIVNKTGTITETIQGEDYTFDLDDIELCKIGNYQDYIRKSTGKNLFNEQDMYKGYYLPATPTAFTQDDKYRTMIINDLPAGTYTFSTTLANCRLLRWFGDDTNSNITRTANKFTFTTTTKGKVMLTFRKEPTSVITETFETQVEKGSTQTPYEPYGKVWYLHKETTEIESYNGETITTDYISTTGGLNNGATIYYGLTNPIDTKITDVTLLNQLNSVGVDLLFAGVVENTGEISLNPREPHYCNLQILDFKTFLSEGELDSFVIYEKTIIEAIQMIINNISDYGFVLGNINILNPNEVIGAYSTKDKTAYDMFQYIADITQSRWFTRMVDQNTVAIDFYDPSLMPEGDAIEYTTEWFKQKDIHDLTFSYSSRDYRNKQIMTSDEVYSSISQNESITASGYQTQYNTTEKIGVINSITVNGVQKTFTTNTEKDLGITADFYYTPKNNYFESDNALATGDVVIISYTAIVNGRQIIINQTEIDRINTATGRKGIVTRYENRRDATTSNELQQIGKSYIKYKGTPEVTLNVATTKNIWNVGNVVEFNAPLDELSTSYMVKKKSINYIVTADTIFYTFELTSSFNSEQDINYFDNQRAKSSGNIGEGENIIRDIDIESTANLIFYGLEAEAIEVMGDNDLDSKLDSPFMD